MRFKSIKLSWDTLYVLKLTWNSTSQTIGPFCFNLCPVVTWFYQFYQRRFPRTFGFGLDIFDIFSYHVLYFLDIIFKTCFCKLRHCFVNLSHKICKVQNCINIRKVWLKILTNITFFEILTYLIFMVMFSVRYVLAKW